jgi:hypothetical protein
MKFPRLSVFAVLMSVCVSGWASQQSAPAAPASPQSTPAVATAPVPVTAQADPKPVIKERAAAYYTALMGGDRRTAEQMLTPESREEFNHIDFKPLAAFTVDDIAVDSSGSKADVTVTRTFGGSYAMSIPWHDQWVNVDGQWLLSLVKPTNETPFGWMMTPSTTKPTPADAEAMKRIAERRARTVDPDQYMKQVEKYVREHPESLAPVEVQVPVSKTQVLPSKPQNDTTVAADNKPAASPNTAKKKKKDTKKSSKTQDGAPQEPKS